MIEIKENLRYLQVPLNTLRNIPLLLIISYAHPITNNCLVSVSVAYASYGRLR
jgi:hypothetical protein